MIVMLKFLEASVGLCHKQGRKLIKIMTFTTPSRESNFLEYMAVPLKQ